MEFYIIIAASIIIILSYIFNRLADRSNIPSVLMLIILGIVSRESVIFFGLDKTSILRTFSDIKLLEILGTLGLILIVLEASLELKIERSKLNLVLKSFLIALSGMLLSMFAIAGIFHFSFDSFDWITSLVYATPLSIISSAIVIPSIVNLSKEKEEFHIYESTFSDILGIMAFYFLVGLSESENNALAVGDFSIGLIVTVVTSVALSYILIYIFQNLETKIKLFLMISVLFLLFSVGKLMHLSSLLIILIFGMVLNNSNVFFAGVLRKHLKPIALENIKEAFLMITKESAFVVRTFFFVIFGFSISLISLFDLTAALVSLFVVIAIYVTRFSSFFAFDRKDIKQPVYIAPRGLITLLLFYSIPEHVKEESFNSAILLFVIIATSLIMTYGLVKNSNEKGEEHYSEVE